MRYSYHLEKRNGASHSSQLRVDSTSLQEVDSVTAYLMKKAASGVWGVIQELSYAKGIATIEEGANGQTPAEVNSTSLLSTISPYFHSALGALQPNHDFGEQYSPSAAIQVRDDDAPPITTNISDSSSCEHNMDADQGGLMFQSAEFNSNENNQRLDYVITQVDISRMSRRASRHLDVDSIQKLPTITYCAKNPSICSSHEEEDSVDEFLNRNAQIIEDYFHNPDENNASKRKKEQTYQFSWMLVPGDPEEEDAARLPSSIQTEHVPDSISICKSNESVNLECNDGEAFEHCAVCNEAFQDGELLRVLPCQHMFHCACISKWQSEEAGGDGCIGSGCSMCKKDDELKAQKEDSPEEIPQEPQGDSHHSDGSVPPWAFRRLGSILGRMT